jgi:hypothetical protein
MNKKEDDKKDLNFGSSDMAIDGAWAISGYATQCGSFGLNPKRNSAWELRGQRSGESEFK